jgi:hypothetical protein
MDPHEGQSNQSSASKMLADETVDSFTILGPSQQGRKAVSLVIQRKHRLMNDRKSRATCLRQCSGLGNSILKNGHLLSLQTISLEVICDRIGMCLGCTQMCVNAASFSLVILARIYTQQKR